MTPRLVPLLAFASLFADGCSTMSDAIDSINPFASSGPKMAKLEAVTPTIDVREQWSASAGKAGDYVFRPAVVGDAVFVAARNGEISWREARQLRYDLQVVRNLEVRYRQGGFNRWEIQDLSQRLDRLERQVQYASRDEDRRGDGGGYGYGYGGGGRGW